MVNSVGQKGGGIKGKEIKRIKERWGERLCRNDREYVDLVECIDIRTCDDVSGCIGMNGCVDMNYSSPMAHRTPPISNTNVPMSRCE